MTKGILDGEEVRKAVMGEHQPRAVAQGAADNVYQSLDMGNLETRTR